MCQTIRLLARRPLGILTRREASLHLDMAQHRHDTWADVPRAQVWMCVPELGWHMKWMEEEGPGGRPGGQTCEQRGERVRAWPISGCGQEDTKPWKGGHTFCMLGQEGHFVPD